MPPDVKLFFDETTVTLCGVGGNFADLGPGTFRGFEVFLSVLPQQPLERLCVAIDDLRKTQLGQCETRWTAYEHRSLGDFVEWFQDRAIKYLDWHRYKSRAAQGDQGAQQWIREVLPEFHLLTQEPHHR
jgi:hypothetical protein